MKTIFAPSQVSRVIDQALVFQCACPAQVCRAIFELRELHEYQMKCVSDSRNDERVHRDIADVAERTHALMEECLIRVLEIEGWDPVSLTMPESLKKKSAKVL